MFQDFHGVAVSGTGNLLTIVNHSTKPIMGYALQRNATRRNAAISFVDPYSWAAGTPVQPGEERPVGRFNVVRVSDEGETIGYELQAVLFTDGTYYGPESIFREFAYMISTVRSLACDAQDSADKYDILARHKAALAPFATAWRSTQIVAVPFHI